MLHDEYDRRRKVYLDALAEGLTDEEARARCDGLTPKEYRAHERLLAAVAKGLNRAAQAAADARKP